MHMPVVNSAYSAKIERYNFQPIFAEIEEQLSAADITVGVLETILTDDYQRLSGYPRFHTPADLAEALRQVGFDLVFTAHNHSLDQGIAGINSTLTQLEAAGLPSTGTRRSSQQKPYYLLEVNGLKLAFFSYTTLTNGLTLPTGHSWALNIFDFKKISWGILQAKAAGVDGIVMALHTGEEYARDPSPADQQLYHGLCTLGVDLILGSHVHVIRPLEKITIKDPFSTYPRTCLIAYSLGNFLSNQRWQYSDCGLMLTLHLRKKLWPPGLEITLRNCSPLFVHRDQLGYRILQVPPPEEAEPTPASLLPAPFQDKFREVWSDTEEILFGWPGGIKQLHPPFF
jgi:poly-gamma-glutamate synthesis protein (capsule biosynthesis protein)